MGHTAEEINAASARQIHLLAQMADKAWPEVEDYCNPSITLDTSDEEEESARLSARAALAASQKVTAVGRSMLDATEMGRAERPDSSRTLLQSFAIEVPVSSLVMKTTGPENVVSEQRFRGHTEPSQASNRVEIDWTSFTMVLRPEDLSEYPDYARRPIRLDLSSEMEVSYDGPTYDHSLPPALFADEYERMQEAYASVDAAIGETVTQSSSASSIVPCFFCGAEGLHVFGCRAPGCILTSTGRDYYACGTCSRLQNCPYCHGPLEPCALSSAQPWVEQQSQPNPSLQHEKGVEEREEPAASPRLSLIHI